MLENLRQLLILQLNVDRNWEAHEAALQGTLLTLGKLNYSISPGKSTTTQIHPVT